VVGGLAQADRLHLRQLRPEQVRPARVRGAHGLEDRRAELDEVSTVRLGVPADHLVIDSWREGEEPKQIRR